MCQKLGTWLRPQRLAQRPGKRFESAAGGRASLAPGAGSRRASQVAQARRMPGTPNNKNVALHPNHSANQPPATNATTPPGLLATLQIERASVRRSRGQRSAMIDGDGAEDPASPQAAPHRETKTDG